MIRTTSGAITPGLGLLMLLGLAVTSACADEPSTPAGSPPLHGLQLAGTVEGNDQRLTGAVFEDPRTKKQTAYRIGDLVDGAMIVEIKRQQVVLKRGEEFVTIQITGGSAVAGQPPGEPGKNTPDSAIPVPAGDPQVARQAVISKVIPPYDPRIEKAKTTVSREDVTRFVGYFQDRLKGERSTLVTTSLGPAVDLGGVDLELLDNLKLESTDRIVEISGMDVDSPRRFLEILDILGRAKIVDISVLRGDVIQPFYYMVN
jgi:type II secretory pathway component PulC